MRLYHATPNRNMPAIRQHGLNPALAKGKRLLIWFHTQSKWVWAINHTMKTHGVSRSEIVVLEVDIPRKDLTRRWRGIWTTNRRVFIKGVIPNEANPEP